MVRWRVAEILEQRGWTPYRLAKEAQLTFPVVYRLAAPNAPVQRIEGRTLEAVCRVLGVQPGDLLEYVPETKRRGKA